MLICQVDTRATSVNNPGMSTPANGAGRMGLSVEHTVHRQLEDDEGETFAKT